MNPQNTDNKHNQKPGTELKQLKTKKMNMKKSGILITLFLSGILLFTSCNKDENGNNNNNQPSEAQTAWSKDLAFPVNPAIGQNYMPAIDENDHIYILSSDYNNGYAIQAFDKDGAELWSKTNNSASPHHNMPTCFQGKLFFTSNQKVVCLNASDGNQLWEYNLPDSMLSISSSIAIAQQKVLITLERETAEHSYLFALNPNDGSVAGALAITSDRVWLNMAAYGNTVYLASGYLYKVTVNADGSMKLDWSVQLPGDDPTYYFNFEKDMVIASNGNVTFAYGELANPSMDILISYNNQGQKLWEYERPYASRITLDEQGHVYDGGINDLIKIDGLTGQKSWAVEPPSESEYISMGSFTSMIHAKDENMYCGDVYGIYGANYSGQIKYAAYASTIGIDNATPFTDITLLSNGNIIVMTMGEDGGNGKIHCIKADTKGISTSGWPKRGADAANTFNASL